MITREKKPITVGELVAALEKLNQKAVLTVVLKGYNHKFGALAHMDSNTDFTVSSGYGASVYISLAPGIVLQDRRPSGERDTII